MESLSLTVAVVLLWLAIAGEAEQCLVKFVDSDFSGPILAQLTLEPRPSSDASCDVLESPQGIFDAMHDYYTLSEKSKFTAVRVKYLDSSTTLRDNMISFVSHWTWVAWRYAYSAPTVGIVFRAKADSSLSTMYTHFRNNYYSTDDTIGEGDGSDEQGKQVFESLAGKMMGDFVASVGRNSAPIAQTLAMTSSKRTTAGRVESKASRTLNRALDRVSKGYAGCIVQVRLQVSAKCRLRIAVAFDFQQQITTVAELWTQLELTAKGDPRHKVPVIAFFGEISPPDSDEKWRYTFHKAGDMNMAAYLWKITWKYVEDYAHVELLKHETVLGLPTFEMSFITMAETIKAIGQPWAKRLLESRVTSL